MSPRLRRQAVAAAQVPGVLLRASMAYRWDISAIMRRVILALKRKYFPKEALGLGLLDPATHPDAFDRFASKTEMLKIQERLNPRSWEWVISDKGIFYRFANASGLPIPRFLGTYYREHGGWSFSGQVLSGAESWADFLLRECPPDIVIKPARSSYGDGVRVFRRQGDVLVDGEGRGWSPATLIASLDDDSNPSYVIQERLFNHEDLAVLSGSPGLQTVRIVTYVKRTGDPVVLSAFFRSVVGSNWIDNQAHGRTGNLIIDVDHQTGILLRAMREGPGPGFSDVPCHPDTGRVLAGARIPMWPEAVGLALRAARVFSMVRTVGWDIAICPTGPVVVEGNFWYDPPTEGSRMYDLFSVFQGDIPPARNAG